MGEALAGLDEGLHGADEPARDGDALLRHLLDHARDIEHLPERLRHHLRDRDGESAGVRRADERRLRGELPAAHHLAAGVCDLVTLRAGAIAPRAALLAEAVGHVAARGEGPRRSLPSQRGVQEGRAARLVQLERGAAPSRADTPHAVRMLGIRPECHVRTVRCAAALQVQVQARSHVLDVVHGWHAQRDQAPCRRCLREVRQRDVGAQLRALGIQEGLGVDVLDRVISVRLPAEVPLRVQAVRVVPYDDVCAVLLASPLDVHVASTGAALDGVRRHSAVDAPLLPVKGVAFVADRGALPGAIGISPPTHVRLQDPLPELQDVLAQAADAAVKDFHHRPVGVVVLEVFRHEVVRRGLHSAVDKLHGCHRVALLEGFQSVSNAIHEVHDAADEAVDVIGGLLRQELGNHGRCLQHDRVHGTEEVVDGALFLEGRDVVPDALHGGGQGNERAHPCLLELLLAPRLLDHVRQQAVH
mmetsp:Transcript_21993/g.62843  ORF Transcript_21993/g.62843 Transcript_21993/m.62843 type:complete len:473 (-) Transcript_21993:487-1905(-)